MQKQKAQFQLVSVTHFPDWRVVFYTLVYNINRQTLGIENDVYIHCQHLLSYLPLQA